ncbi:MULTISPECIES: hypothetical protein [unclassified Kitasatospora]|uniref:hypothetical protein n=1 Tax=unclassified Kitasatospora TaxID=2633591 RepID=UPI00070D7F56|nr:MULTISPECIES: hypothetical protein [unclassified Kitasatospora]KQV20949.1 hypothetical protein ASC99_20825 [Kitasatospora sp. Root107]KRB60397.1 hypothetical protein ASE03_12355 [Kitasatospora sp. Root187]
MLLGAFQHRFGGDVEALAAYLIDAPAIGWSTLGSELVDSAPDDVRAAINGPWGSEPSKQFDADEIISSDGSAPAKDIVTHDNTEGLDWAYVLHPHGVEVIGLYEHERGPLVPWDTDPTTRFTDRAELWSKDSRLMSLMPKAAAAAARASSGKIRSASAPPATPDEPAPTPAVVVTKSAARAR